MGRKRAEETSERETAPFDFGAKTFDSRHVLAGPRTVVVV
jgi:hypothetical protein